LRSGDIDGILATYNDGVQAVVRDYVNNTGGLCSLPGKEPHRDYYRALFKKYDVQSVELLYRVSQAWYVFSELRLTMREREGAGQTIAFHIAEMFAPAEDGRFIARVGHGTDPAAQ
jgi:hypothetical protein